MLKQKSNAGFDDADTVRIMKDTLETNVDDFIVAIFDNEKDILDKWTIPQLESKRQSFHASAQYLSKYSSDYETQSYYTAKLPVLDRYLQQLTLYVQHRTQVDFLIDEFRKIEKQMNQDSQNISTKEVADLRKRFDWINENEKWLKTHFKNTDSQLCQKLKLKLKNFHTESCRMAQKITTQQIESIESVLQSKKSMHQNTFLRYMPNVFLHN
jgi:hypothetical protein